MGLRPLIITIKVFSQPGISRGNALCRFAVMHIVIEVWNDESNGRQLGVIGGKIREPQVGRSFDRPAIGNIAKTDPGDMLAAIDAASSLAVGQIERNSRIAAASAGVMPSSSAVRNTRSVTSKMPVAFAFARGKENPCRSSSTWITPPAFTR